MINLPFIDKNIEIFLPLVGNVDISGPKQKTPGRNHQRRGEFAEKRKKHDLLHQVFRLFGERTAR